MMKPQIQKQKAIERPKPRFKAPPAATKSLKAKKPPPTPSNNPFDSQASLPTVSLLKTGALKVLNDLRREVKKSYEGHRSALRSAIARGCEVASFLEKNKCQWLAFCNSPIWESRTRRPNPKKPSEALRFVLVWISGPSRIGEKRASKWYRAVGPLMEKGVQFRDIPAAITAAGGIEALARQNAEKKRSSSEKGKVERPLPHKCAMPKASFDSAEALKGPLPQKGIRVTLKATLEREGKGLLGLPSGSEALLTTQILGQKNRVFEVVVLNVEQIAGFE